MQQSLKVNVERSRTVAQLCAVALWATSEVAHAQAIGQGLMSYATPIVLFLGLGSILVALVGAVFNPQWVKSAVYAAIILAIIFFILRNASSLQAAVQQ